MAKIIRNGVDYSPVLAADAVYINYNNTDSGMSAENVQDAIDELSDKQVPIASTSTVGVIKVGTNLSIIADGTLSATDTTDSAEITYDNATSGLSAANVQAAIDEVVANAYVLPKASATTLGGIKVGTNLSIDSTTGVLSATDTTDSADITYDNSTSGMTASNVQAAIDELNTKPIPVATTSSAGIVQVGTNLSVTSAGVLSATDTTDSAEITYDNTSSGLTASNVQAAIDELNTKEYTLPAATTSTLGGVIVGANLAVDKNGVLSGTIDAADEISYANTTSGLDATTVQAAIDELKAEEYVLPKASSDVLGGVKVGDTLEIDGNGKLGVKDDIIIQVTSLPSASADNAGQIRQYIGTTTSNYTNGYFYKSNGTAWEKVNVQDAFDLPVATESTLGGIKVGTNLSVTSDGVLSATDTTDSAEITYDNTSSGLTASNVQAAIDELKDDALVIDDSASSATKVYSSQKVENLIGSLPKSMVYKGTVGVGGTITDLPAASAANEGFVYLVCSDGTYASKAAKVGDMFVSNGTAWTLIPSGDDPVLAQSVVYDNDTSGLTATDVQAAIDEIVANAYELPVATRGSLGGIIVGDNLSVTLDGKLSAENIVQKLSLPSAATSTGTIYQYVGETNTNYTNGYFYKSNGSTWEKVNVQDAFDLPIASASILGGIKVGTNLSIDSSTGVLSATDTTDSADITYDNSTSGMTASNVQAAIDELKAGEYTLPVATASVLGGIKVGANLSITTDGVLSGTGGAASDITYDNADSGLTASDVQDAIDELAAKELPVATALVLGGIKVGANLAVTADGILSGTVDAANEVSYANTSSGLVATTVQEAIDEVYGKTWTGTYAQYQAIAIKDPNTTYFITDAGRDPIAVFAGSVAYDNTTSGLAATDIQAAVDELASSSRNGAKNSYNIEVLTEAEYNALAVKDPSTLYFIK